MDSRLFSSALDNKKRARLNAIVHLLKQTPCEEVPREKVKLPDRQKEHGYEEPGYPLQVCTEVDVAIQLTERRIAPGFPRIAPRRVDAQAPFEERFGFSRLS